MVQSPGRRGEGRISKTPGMVSGPKPSARTLDHSHPLHGGDYEEATRRQTLKPYCVVSATSHISYNHVWNWQNLPVFRLLDEDGHSPRHQLAVVLYPLRPGDELPIRVVPCSDQSQWSATAAAQSTIHCGDRLSACPNLARGTSAGHLCQPRQPSPI